jgi:hypothetical protein
MKLLFLFLLTLTGTQVLFAQITTIRKAPSTAIASCCGFRAGNSTDIPMVVNFGKESTVVFDKEVYDDANAFNGASFKTPSEGVYQFILHIGLKAKNSGVDISQVMVKIKTASQSSSQVINIPGNYDNIITANLTAQYKLQANEEVSVVLVGLGSATAATTGNLSYFSGIKLY